MELAYSRLDRALSPAASAGFLDESLIVEEKKKEGRLSTGFDAGLSVIYSFPLNFVYARHAGGRAGTAIQESRESERERRASPPRGVEDQRRRKVLLQNELRSKLASAPEHA